MKYPWHSFFVILPILVTTFLLATPLTSLPSNKTTSFSLELIHRDSLEFNGSLTYEERLQKYIKISESRASYLLSKSVLTYNKTSSNPNSIRPSLFQDTLVYLVKLPIGNPPNPFYLAFDTGSDLTWLQCKPCNECFPLKYPSFDPSFSKSYEKVPCTNPLCSRFACANQQCVYKRVYGEGSSTEGVVSQESLHIPLREGSQSHINNFLLGCGHNNKGFLFSVTQNAAGVFGIDRSPNSFLGQLGTYVLNRFSYCLVKISPDGKTPVGYIKFGTDMGYRGGSVRSTPFVKHPISTAYYLNLLDISVNNKRLYYPPGFFKIKEDGTGGVIIDTGATISFMDSDAYRKLEDEVLNYFSGFKSLERRGSCRFQVPLCYSMPPDFQSFPSMTFHFQGADLHLEPEQVFIIDRRKNTFDLAITPSSSGLTILLGAWQQHNTRFTYDLNVNLLSFVPEDCSKDTG